MLHLPTARQRAQFPDEIALLIKNGNVTAYSYDSMGRPTATSSGSSSVTNTYQNDLLSTITHTNTGSKNTVYTLSYGPADLLTGVKVGSRNLVTNQYTSGRWTLAKQTYGNGDYRKYSYNNSDQLTLRFTNQTDSSGISYAYLYNSKGQLRQVDRSSVTIANEAITGSTLQLRLCPRRSVRNPLSRMHLFPKRPPPKQRDLRTARRQMRQQKL